MLPTEALIIRSSGESLRIFSQRVVNTILSYEFGVITDVDHAGTRGSDIGYGPASGLLGLSSNDASGF